MENTDVPIEKLAQQCFHAVFRTDIDKTGFQYFNLGTVKIKRNLLW